MTDNEMKELAKEAAKSAVLASSRHYNMDSFESVDVFLNSYEYAMKKLLEKQKSQAPRPNFFVEQEVKCGKTR